MVKLCGEAVAIPTSCLFGSKWDGEHKIPLKLPPSINGVIIRKKPRKKNPQDTR
jgi:hypothetical protein